MVGEHPLNYLREPGGVTTRRIDRPREQATRLPIEGFDPTARDWYQHPGASDFMSFFKQKPGYYPIPEGAPPSFRNDPGAFLKWTQSGEGQGFTPAAADTVQGQQGAAEQTRGAIQGAASTIQDTTQRAIAALRSGQGYKALEQYADPRFEIVPQEFIDSVRQSAGRSIAKQQANTLNEANRILTSRGQADSNLAGQNKVASDFRREAALSDIDAQLQQDALVANENFRRAAAQGLTQADLNIMNAESAAGAGAASLLASQPFTYIDYTQFDTGAYDEAIGVADEMTSLVQENLDHFMELAETEEERQSLEEIASDERDSYSGLLTALPFIWQLISGGVF